MLSVNRKIKIVIVMSVFSAFMSHVIVVSHDNFQISVKYEDLMSITYFLIESKLR